MRTYAILGIIILIGVLGVWVDAKMNAALAPIIEEHM